MHVSVSIPFFLNCCVGWGVHCSIYEGSYSVSNISYLNLPPPLLFFIHSSPNSWNSFNRYHFCIYIHVYTLALYSYSHPFPPPPPPSNQCQNFTHPQHTTACRTCSPPAINIGEDAGKKEPSNTAGGKVN
jgi:hypothetical protein